MVSIRIPSKILASPLLLMILSLQFCIFESKQNIKNLTASSYSVPLKTPKTKLEVIPPKVVEEDTF